MASALATTSSEPLRRPGAIGNAFSALRDRRRRAFVPYITAGDPSLAGTRDLIRGLEEAGADLIEVGVPFSDPMADGPVIQSSSQRALERGVRLD